MNYNLIGAGNVAWFFGRRLKEKGHICSGVYGRNARSVSALAKEVYSPNFGSLLDVKDDADICIMAVSDTAIEELAHQISLKNSVLVHTAGSVSIGTLSNSASDYGVIWPVYSILKNDLPIHRQIPFVWEASSEKAKQQILMVTNAISDITYEVKGEQRRWLHLAAVMGNNFTNYLISVCELICKEQNISFSILLPILQQTFDRIKLVSPSDVQTGPAKRGDHNTINKHLDILRNHPDWQDLYKSLSLSIEKMYKKGQ
jgi:predicted short-subunit dehydrogenase-like oxidoreductase (DUF2520 family)